MSAQNTKPGAKEARRLERADRKARAARNIPHLGVRISKKIVLAHRYLAAHGLPFSYSAAIVYVK